MTRPTLKAGCGGVPLGTARLGGRGKNMWRHLSDKAQVNVVHRSLSDPPATPWAHTSNIATGCRNGEDSGMTGPIGRVPFPSPLPHACTPSGNKLVAVVPSLKRDLKLPGPNHSDASGRETQGWSPANLSRPGTGVHHAPAIWVRQEGRCLVSLALVARLCVGSAVGPTWESRRSASWDLPAPAGTHACVAGQEMGRPL